MSLTNNVCENTEAMNPIEKTPKDALVEFLKCDPVLKNSMICDDEAAALILNVKVLTENHYKILVIIYSAQSNGIVEAAFFNRNQIEMICNFCYDSICFGYVYSDIKPKTTDTCENVATKASRGLCNYHYADGNLINKNSGDTIFVNHYMIVSDALHKSTCKTAKSRECSVPDLFNTPYISDEELLKKLKPYIKQVYNHPEKNKLKIEPIKNLKDYKCIKKEKIDALLGNAKNRCYKLLENQDIMYKSNSDEGHGYRCREKDKNGNAKGFYIAIKSSFLEEKEYE